MSALTTLTEAQDAYLLAYNDREDARERKAWPEFCKRDREVTAASEKLSRLQQETRAAFAQSRGWRFNRKRGDPRVAEYGQYSRRLIRDVEFYNDSDGHTVGMVTHCFAKPDEIAGYAARHGYAAELLPFSWKHPGRGIAVLLTLKAGATWPK